MAILTEPGLNDGQFSEPKRLIMPTAIKVRDGDESVSLGCLSTQSCCLQDRGRSRHGGTVVPGHTTRIQVEAGAREGDPGHCLDDVVPGVGSPGKRLFDVGLPGGEVASATDGLAERDQCLSPAGARLCSEPKRTFQERDRRGGTTDV